MSLFKSIVCERAPTVAFTTADIISSLVTSKVEVEEMRKARGDEFSTTNFYQIRVKPLSAQAERKDLLNKIHAIIKSKAKDLGISDIQINSVSRNSSKFSSVSFKIGDIMYDVVVAAGANRGERFEKELLLKLDNLVAGHDSTEEAEAALAALGEVDPSIKLSNIVSVTPRAGATQRSRAVTAEHTGKIIGDVIIKLKRGGERYISIKDIDGTTVAKFGVSRAFSDDLKVNANSYEWKEWLEPFGLEKEKIEQGLTAYVEDADVPWPDVVQLDNKIKPGSQVFSIFEKLWGSDYIYLKKKAGGFFAMIVDKESIDSVILKNLRITEIRYPSKARKQITISAESDSMKFRIEIRNTSGRGAVKPAEIQLSIAKSFI